MVPMRDGVRLATDIYRPDAPGRFPALVTRGPYGKDGYADNQEHSIWFFPQRGYVVVSQDCRARFDSEGDNYDPLFQEGQDGYDNRRVGRPPALVQRARRHYRPVLPRRNAVHPRRRATPAASGLHGPGVGVGGLPPELGLPHRRRNGVGLDGALCHPQRPQHPGPRRPRGLAGPDGRVRPAARQLRPAADRCLVPPPAPARLD